jgi:anthranilate synthase component 2
LKEVYHGVATNCNIIQPDTLLLKGLGSKILAGRYHSWILANENFPDTLEITATDDQGYIMAIQHKELDLCGLQFHPESILTPDGAHIMRNFLTH